MLSGGLRTQPISSHVEKIVGNHYIPQKGVTRAGLELKRGRFSLELKAGVLVAKAFEGWKSFSQGDDGLTALLKLF